MDFHDLHFLLTDHLRERVRNGELTERGIARATGVSQPHIHNVLKGKRLLSTAMADEILRELRLDLLDLLKSEKLVDARRRR